MKSLGEVSTGGEGMRVISGWETGRIYARIVLVLGFLLSGCSGIHDAIGGSSYKSRAKAIRLEGEQLRPGDVGTFLRENSDEKLRFLAYKVLEQHRVRLRSGNTQWSPLDLVAMEEEAHRDMDSSYGPLSNVARQHYIWARLEALEPGELAGLIKSEYTLDVVTWIMDWEKPGRPQIEGRLNRKDYEAVQMYSMARLPSSRYLLRWSLEQDHRPGQVAGFLSEDWSDQQLVEILRMWCTSEGWSPLVHADTMRPSDREAVRATLSRLEQSRDPLVRREASKWRSWVVRRAPILARR